MRLGGTGPIVMMGVTKGQEGLKPGELRGSELELAVVGSIKVNGLAW